MKNDPKAMKAKADRMLKLGALSDKEHKKLHAKADAELARMKGAKADPAATDAETGSDTPEADDPSATYRKRGSDVVTRGQPLDEEEKDD